MALPEDSITKQRSGVADVREDEEQARRFDDIVKLLVAAGYFRARIKALSSFDRVVGGIAWAISFSDVDIDVDLDVLFQENATIGTKIALTEKVVRVLRLMRCPVLLEPHQLQGLDFKSIFPAVQWLVRNAVDTRQQLASFMARQADYQRQRVFGFDEMPVKSAATVSTVDATFPPSRRFRHGDPRSVQQEEMRVSVTLMEYGDSSSLVGSTQNEATEQQQQGTVDAMEEEQKQQILGQMAALSSRKQPGTGAAVRNALVGAADDLRQLAAARRQALEAADREREEQLSAGRQIEILTEGIADVKQKLAETNEQRSKIAEEVAEPQKRRDQVAARAEQVRQRMAELDALWAGEHRETLETISALMAERSNLERVEKESKAQWRGEHEKLSASLAEAEAAAAAGKRLGGDRLGELRESVAVAEKRLAEARLALAKRARRVAVITRKLDEIPSRTELAQYQRRFVELFELIAELHRQTKQLYRRHNMVDDNRLIVGRELDLLNALIQAYPKAFPTPTSSNATAVSELLRQLEAAGQSVSESKAKAEQRKKVTKDSLLKAGQRLATLLEFQRSYSKLLAEFAAECHRQQQQ